MSKFDCRIETEDWNLYNSSGNYYSLENLCAYSVWGNGNYVIFTTRNGFREPVYVGLSKNLRDRLYYSHKNNSEFQTYTPLYVTWLNLYQLGIKDPHGYIKGGIENYLGNLLLPLIGKQWSKNTKIPVDHPFVQHKTI